MELTYTFEVDTALEDVDDILNLIIGEGEVIQPPPKRMNVRGKITINVSEMEGMETLLNLKDDIERVGSSSFEIISVSTTPIKQRKH